MFKNIRTILCFCFVGLLVSPIYSGGVNKPEIIKIADEKLIADKRGYADAKILTILAYGKGDNNLGVYPEPSMCPQSFYVRGNTIVFLDVMNDRVLKMQGNQTSSCNIDENKEYINVFMAENGSVVLSDVNGQETIELDKNCKEEKIDNISESEYQGIKLYLGKLIRNKNIIGIKDDVSSPKIQNLVIERNKKVEYFSMDFTEINATNLRFIGCDVKGNNYIYFSHIPEGVMPHESGRFDNYVIAISSVGKVIGMVKIRSGFYFHPWRDVVIDDEGSIYQMWLGDKEAIVYEY